MAAGSGSCPSCISVSCRAIGFRSHTPVVSEYRRLLSGWPEVLRVTWSGGLGLLPPEKHGRDLYGLKRFRAITGVAAVSTQTTAQSRTNSASALRGG